MFERFLNKVNAISMDAVIKQVMLMQTVQDYITDLNRAQLLKGIDADSNKIQPKYALSTKRLKRRLGLPFNRVTLKHKGGYHRSYKVLPHDTNAEVFTNVELQRGFNLSEHLRQRYGDHIQGLTDKSMEKLQNFLKQFIIEQYKHDLTAG